MDVLLENKKARMEYSFQESFEAGVQLLGPEVKMLRAKRGSLLGAHVRVVGGEAVLLNMQIQANEYARNDEYDPKRTRKLLLHKNEILKLQQAQGMKGLTLIPTMVGVKRNHIKVMVAIAKGKQQYERRDELRKRDMMRDAERESKSRVR